MVFRRRRLQGDDFKAAYSLRAGSLRRPSLARCGIRGGNVRKRNVMAVRPVTRDEMMMIIALRSSRPKVELDRRLQAPWALADQSHDSSSHRWVIRRLTVRNVNIKDAPFDLQGFHHSRQDITEQRATVPIPGSGGPDRLLISLLRSRTYDTMKDGPALGGSWSDLGPCAWPRAHGAMVTDSRTSRTAAMFLPSSSEHSDERYFNLFLRLQKSMLHQPCSDYTTLLMSMMIDELPWPRRSDRNRIILEKTNSMFALRQEISSSMQGLFLDVSTAVTWLKRKAGCLGRDAAQRGLCCYYYDTCLQGTYCSTVLPVVIDGLQRQMTRHDLLEVEKKKIKLSSTSLWPPPSPPLQRPVQHDHQLFWRVTGVSIHMSPQKNHVQSRLLVGCCDRWSARGNKPPERLIIAWTLSSAITVPGLGDLQPPYPIPSSPENPPPSEHFAHPQSRFSCATTFERRRFRRHSLSQKLASITSPLTRCYA
nr:hypothetical protein CFP56_66177 [Quercus suber]